LGQNFDAFKALVSIAAGDALALVGAVFEDGRPDPQ
jgi:hypothetical protein